MKKIITLLLFAGVTTFSFSQDIKYGVHVATNVSNMDYEVDGIVLLREYLKKYHFQSCI